MRSWHKDDTRFVLQSSTDQTALPWDNNKWTVVTTYNVVVNGTANYHGVRRLAEHHLAEARRLQPELKWRLIAITSVVEPIG